VAPLVQPQKEEDDAGEIAKRDIHDNAKSRAHLFCVETVEQLALAVLFIGLGRAFGDCVQGCATSHARACVCEVGGGEPSFPADIGRTNIVVVVEVELIVRDGAMRRQVFRGARFKVVAQIGIVRESDPQSRTRIDDTIAPLSACSHH
jgi:hypothetical protein